MKRILLLAVAVLIWFQIDAVLNQACAGSRSIETPFLESEIIFPLEVWHNHASCIVECPNGDLLVQITTMAGEPVRDRVEIRLQRAPGESGSGGEAMELSVKMATRSDLNITAVARTTAIRRT